ncbi:hypothetical protein [Nitrosospira sp. Nl5]|nr:hypothetical protein [Nitrosospira sp. Nl5]
MSGQLPDLEKAYDKLDKHMMEFAVSHCKTGMEDGVYCRVWP